MYKVEEKWKKFQHKPGHVDQHYSFNQGKTKHLPLINGVKKNKLLYFCPSSIIYFVFVDT